MTDSFMVQKLNQSIRVFYNAMSYPTSTENYKETVFPSFNTALNLIYLDASLSFISCQTIEPSIHITFILASRTSVLFAFHSIWCSLA